MDIEKMIPFLATVNSENILAFLDAVEKTLDAAKATVKEFKETVKKFLKIRESVMNAANILKTFQK